MNVENNEELNQQNLPQINPQAENSERPFMWIFRKHLSYETETAWFVLVSALDIWMTYILLTTTDNVREGNPIAAFFINRWGAAGMVKFKFVLVAFVAVAAQVIAQKRPQTARAILLFGTAIVGFVVLYSAVLFVRNV